MAEMKGTHCGVDRPTRVPPQASPSVRRLFRRAPTGPVRELLLLLGLVVLAAGIVAATSYITTSGGTNHATGSFQPGSTCGFVNITGITNTVGNGSQSGPNYISFNPTLSPNSVTQTVTATLNQYATGPTGSEYLIDELAFGCQSVSAGAVVQFSVSATSSTGNAKWVVMEVSFDKNNPRLNPTIGLPCDRANGGLYLPYGATQSTWDSLTSNYTGGDTYTFTANQTGGVHLTDDSCTANAPQPGIPNLVIPGTVSSLTLYYYFSFAIVGASSSIAITNPAFTLSFN